MGDDVVDDVAAGRQVLPRVRKLLRVGQLARPPARAGDARVRIGALPAPEGEDLVAFDRVDLAAEQLVAFAADLPRLPAAEVDDRVARERTLRDTVAQALLAAFPLKRPRSAWTSPVT